MPRVLGVIPRCGIAINAVAIPDVLKDLTWGVGGGDVTEK